MGRSGTREGARGSRRDKRREEQSHAYDPWDEPTDAFDLEARALNQARDLAGEVPTTQVHRRRLPRGYVLRRALVVADVVGVFLALAIVQLTVVNRWQPRDLYIHALAIVGLAGWVVLANVYGLYERDGISMARSTADDLPGLLLLATLATWLGLLTVNALDLSHPRLHVAATFWLLAIALVAAGRALARSLVQRRLRTREATIIVGAGRVGTRIAEKLALRPEYGLEIVGFLDDDPLTRDGNGAPYLGGVARLEQVIRAYEVDRVIVAFSRLSGDEQVTLLRRCLDLGVQVDVVPRMYEVIGSRTTVHDLDGLPLVTLRPPQLTRSARLLKRALDVMVAGISLIVFAPFFAVMAWRIKAGSPGPVFFRQERMGAGGRRFEIFKFRSMYIDADERKGDVEHLNKHTEQGPKMFKIPDDPRITPVGRFLRRFSLDELPQLINVLKGEMSLVGPRPLILDEDRHIVGHGRRRLNLTPGITGLWQVLGRSDIPFSEMVTLDYLYVNNWSLWGDIKLLARTLPVVARKRGAY